MPIVVVLTAVGAGVLGLVAGILAGMAIEEDWR